MLMGRHPSKADPVYFLALSCLGVERLVAAEVTGPRGADFGVPYRTGDSWTLGGARRAARARQVRRRSSTCRRRREMASAL
jgi:hypothetical protein